MPPQRTLRLAAFVRFRSQIPVSSRRPPSATSCYHWWLEDDSTVSSRQETTSASNRHLVKSCVSIPLAGTARHRCLQFPGSGERRRRATCHREKVPPHCRRCRPNHTAFASCHYLLTASRCAIRYQRTW